MASKKERAVSEALRTLNNPALGLRDTETLEAAACLSEHRDLVAGVTSRFENELFLDGGKTATVIIEDPKLLAIPTRRGVVVIFDRRRGNPGDGKA